MVKSRCYAQKIKFNSFYRHQCESLILFLGPNSAQISNTRKSTLGSSTLSVSGNFVRIAVFRFRRCPRTWFKIPAPCCDGWSRFPASCRDGCSRLRRLAGMGAPGSGALPGAGLGSGALPGWVLQAPAPCREVVYRLRRPAGMDGPGSGALPECGLGLRRPAGMGGPGSGALPEGGLGLRRDGWSWLRHPAGRWAWAPAPCRDGWSRLRRHAGRWSWAPAPCRDGCSRLRRLAGMGAPGSGALPGGGLGSGALPGWVLQAPAPCR